MKLYVITLLDTHYSLPLVPDFDIPDPARKRRCCVSQHERETTLKEIFWRIEKFWRELFMAVSDTTPARFHLMLAAALCMTSRNQFIEGKETAVRIAEARYSEVLRSCFLA